MFGNKIIDNIGILEQKATEHLGQIDAFIEMFTSAQEDAEKLNDEATKEIARLSEVQKKCNRITSFTEKLLSIKEK